MPSCCILCFFVILRRDVPVYFNFDLFVFFYLLIGKHRVIPLSLRRQRAVHNILTLIRQQAIIIVKTLQKSPLR